MRFLRTDKISTIKIVDQPDFAASIYLKKSQQYGIAYERQVNAKLIKQFGDYYRPKIWLLYRERGKSTTEYCELDGLLLQPEKNLITIVEIKLRHTIKAWTQLEGKYLPLVKKLFSTGKWKYATCEVVKYFKDIKMPVDPVMCNGIDQAKPGEFAIYVLRV